MIEEARTNLKLWSERIEVDFSRIRSDIIENAIVSPYGTQTADGMVPSSTTVSSKYIDKVLTGFSASQNVCTSAFFKKGVGRDVWLQIYEESGNAYHGVQFNFETEELTFRNSNEYTSGNGITTDYGFEKYPNGWYRLWIAGYPNTTTTGRRIRIRLTNQTGSLDFSGDGISSYLYVWGVQCEIGSFPTSYIPTQGSTRTRAADNAKITGKNFSEWYRQDEGTFFVDAAEPSAFVAYQAYLTLQGASITDEIRIWRLNLTTATFNHLLNNATQGVINLVINTIANKIARSYSLAQGIVGSANGGSNVQATLSSTTPVTSLRIGARGNNTFYGNRTYKRIAYYPKRLPNSQLQALTR